MTGTRKRIEKKQKSRRGGSRPGAGRKPGIGNKDLKPLRQRIQDLIDSNSDRLERNVAKLSPAAHADFFLRLYEFAVPKLRRLNMEIELKHSKILIAQAMVYFEGMPEAEQLEVYQIVEQLRKTA